MENLPFILLALACPIGMGLMMLLMGKGMMGMRGKDQAPRTPSDPSLDPDKRLAALLAQRELLDAQIAASTESGEPQPPLHRTFGTGTTERL